MKINFLNIARKAGFSPISLQDAKTYLRITHEHDDTLLNSMITSVISICESYTSIALCEQEVDFICVGLRHNMIELPIRYVREIISAGTIDENDNYKKLSLKQYKLLPQQNAIKLANHYNMHALKIHYLAGVSEGETIEEGLRLILLSHIAFCYENRALPSEFKMSAYNQFKKYRL